MGGPWEKYANKQESGPWDKYQSSATKADPAQALRNMAAQAPAIEKQYPSTPSYLQSFAASDNPVLKFLGDAISNEQETGRSMAHNFANRPVSVQQQLENIPGPVDTVKGFVGGNPGTTFSNTLNAILLHKATSGKLGQRGSLAQDITPQSNGFSKAVNRVSNAVGPNGEPMGNTTPELVERNLGALQDSTPPSAASTVRKPAILSRVDTMLGTVENKFKGVLNTRTPNGSTIGDSVQVPGSRIADAIEKKITPALEKAEPDVAAALKAEAENYRNHPAGTNNINIAGPNATLQGPPKTFTLNELNEIRQMKNAQNDAFHSGDPMQQFTASKNPQATKIANRIIENETRNALYEKMGSQNLGLSESEIRQMKQQQGDMMALKQQLQDRLAGLTEQAASGKGAKLLNKIRGSVHPYASPHGLGMHASSLLNLIEPQAMTDLRGIAASDQVFAPRSNPFAPVVPASIAGLLSGKK